MKPTNIAPIKVKNGSIGSVWSVCGFSWLIANICTVSIRNYKKHIKVSTNFVYRFPQPVGRPVFPALFCFPNPRPKVKEYDEQNQRVDTGDYHKLRAEYL